MYFNIGICLLAFSVLNGIDSYKCSNKTYCEHVIPVFGDDEAYPIFTGSIIHSTLKDKDNTKNTRNKWNVIKRMFINVSKRKNVYPLHILESLKLTLKNKRIKGENEKKGRNDDENLYARLLFST